MLIARQHIFCNPHEGADLILVESVARTQLFMESIRLQSFLKIGSGWGDRYVAGMSIRRRILFSPALRSPQPEPHRNPDHPTDLIQLGSQEQEGRHNFREMLLC